MQINLDHIQGGLMMLILVSMIKLSYWHGETKDWIAILMIAAVAYLITTLIKYS